MRKGTLLDFHRENWYNKAGIAFEDIELHISNFKRVDEVVPPGPRFYLVANFNTFQYDFIGKGQHLLTGYENELVAKEGFQFQLANIHPEDAEYIVKQSYPTFQRVLSTFSFEEQKDILLQNNYRFRHKEGHYVHLMEQVWAMKADEKGNHQLMLVHVYELPMVQPFTVNTVIKKLLPDKTYEILYAKEFAGPKEIEQLSQREAEIIRLLADGLNSKQIAQQLFISFHTVRTHRKNMLQKLKMKSTNELVAYGLTHGIIR